MQNPPTDIIKFVTFTNFVPSSSLKNKQKLLIVPINNQTFCCCDFSPFTLPSYFSSIHLKNVPFQQSVRIFRTQIANAVRTSCVYISCSLATVAKQTPIHGKTSALRHFRHTRRLFSYIFLCAVCHTNARCRESVARRYLDTKPRHARDCRHKPTTAVRLRKF